MKKKIILLFSLLFIVIISVFGYFIFKNEKAKELTKKLEEKRIKVLINNIKSKYNKTVITNKEANIYLKENNKYKEVGKLGEDIILTLDDISIDENSLYFPIIGLNDDYYISFYDVEKYKDNVDLIDEFTKRYKKYIPFNKNVVTKEVVKLYKDEKLMYMLPESIDTPIIIMEEDKYYIEYNDDLYYVLKSDVEVKDSNNSSERLATEIPTIAYHFIYDPSKDGVCNQVICHTLSQVRSHLDYLKNNDYFALTLEEFDLWIDRKINLPVKSLVITQDDGGYAQNSKELFNEYKIRDNIFIVTSWFNENEFKSDYTGIYSHTDNLHNVNQCPGYGYQGAGMLCVNMTDLVNDLKLSREKTSNSIALAYPFYGVNEHAISAMKEAGFKLGFGGLYANGYGNMRQGADKYRIPRYTFLNTTTVSDLANILLR